MMSSVLVAVIVLYSLGGILPLAAIVQAAVVTGRRFRQLNSDLEQIRQIADAAGPTIREQNAAEEAQRAVRQPSVSAWYWVPYGPEIAQRDVFRELKKPAILAGLGIAAATAGGLLSLWL